MWRKKCTCFDLLLGMYNISHIYGYNLKGGGKESVRGLVGDITWPKCHQPIYFDLQCNLHISASEDKSPLSFTGS
jgi:hypothetical protein